MEGKFGSADEVFSVQDLVDISPFPVWKTDSRGFFTYLSSHWDGYLGYSLFDLKNKHIWDLVETLDRTRFISEISRHQIISGVCDIQCVFVHKSGEEIPVELRIKFSGMSNQTSFEMMGMVKLMAPSGLMEKLLRESEEKFVALFEKGPIGVAYHRMIYDQKGKPIDYLFLDANEQYQKLTGVDPRGKLVTKAFPGIERDPFDWIGTFGRVAQLGEDIRFEQYLEINDRWYDCVGYQYKPDHFVAAFIEITDRKKVESTLKDRNEFVESLIDLTPDILYVFDIQEHKNIFSNDALQRCLGYTSEEVLQMGEGMMDQLLHPDDRKTYLEQTVPKYLSLPDKEQMVTRYRMRHKNGSWRWLSSNELIYRRNPDGTPRQIFGITHDFTENKLAEEALKRQNNIMASLLKNLPVGVFMIEAPSGVPLLVNDVAVNILGRGFVPGVSIDNITQVYKAYKAETNDLYPLSETPIQLGMNGKASHVDDMEVCQPDGKRVLLEVYGSPVTDDDGNIWASLVSFLDITNRKKEEEARERLEKHLNQNQKLESLGILAGGIAHDFNNLLTGIYGYLQLASGVSQDNKVKEYLEKTRQTLERAKDLTKQLLTFAKGGQPVLDQGTLFPFIRETALFALSGSNVVYSEEVPGDLWNCQYDKNQMAQVVDNLVINAKQAMETGGTITVRAQNLTLSPAEYPNLPPGNYVKIAFEDTGQGISNEQISKIFDPFYSTKSTGHGLGLTTCYSIVQRHGGAMEVKSVLGSGSVFYLYLPAANGPLVEPQKAVSSTHKGQGTFIIMDDEPVILEILTNMLKGFGYKVVATKDGQEAMNAYKSLLQKKGKLTGMIFDLTVPGGNGGRWAIEQVRKIDKEIPVFVASGYGDDSIMGNPLEFGFTGRLSKPFDLDDLKKMLQEHFD